MPHMATKKAAQRPKTRPVAAGNINTTATVLRVDAAMMAGLDAWVDRLNEGAVGPKWTRSHLVRAVLARALKERGEKGEMP